MATATELAANLRQERAPIDVDALTAATGPAADALFLQLMTEHHAAGVHMAAYAAERAGDDGVRDLATRLPRNQALEITEFAHVAERLGISLDAGSVDLGQDPFAASG